MDDLLQQEFRTLPDLIRGHAARAPEHRALVDGQGELSYAALDARMDRVAAALQHGGLKTGDAIAVCAASSVAYATVFLGALRAGMVVAPLAPGSTPESLSRMVGDAQARVLFVDAAAADTFGPQGAPGVPRIALDGSVVGQGLEDWLAPVGATPQPATITPGSPFNIIYSSGTTGEPKGIVQSHGMRWTHVRRGGTYRYGPDAVTLLSTPLYSNTRDP